MITRINPPIPLDTPRGKGCAHFILDYGTEFDLIWVVFIDDTGECWCYRNSEIRLQKNLTFGRQSTSSIPSMGVVPAAMPVKPARHYEYPHQTSVGTPGLVSQSTEPVCGSKLTPMSPPE